MDRSLIYIQITPGNLRNDSMYLSRHPDFFPIEAIGASSRKKGVGKSLNLEVAGIPEIVETDIAGDKLIFRTRSWCREFFKVHHSQVGDTIVIEKVSQYHFRIYPKAK